MISQRFLFTTTLLLVLCFLSGCAESDRVTVHKPGVYKGANDPLLEKQRQPETAEKLIERFNLVQTDR